MKNLTSTLGVLCVIALLTVFASIVQQKDKVLDTAGSTTSIASVSSSVQSVTPTDAQIITLVDQNFAHVKGTTGAARLKAMQTKLIKGNMESGSLTFELDRGENKKSFSAVSMYVMPIIDGKVQPEKEWKRFRFVDAQYIGNCSRALSPKSNFTTLGKQTAVATYDLASFPTTNEDPCVNTTEVHNFIRSMNTENTDVDFAFGFMPSDYGNLKVSLRYSGDITVSDFLK